MKILISILSLALCLLQVTPAQAQITNKGAAITIQAGTNVYATDVNNHSSASATGAIILAGTLELKGDLVNTATLTTHSGSLLKFTGDSNSNCTTNGGIIENMELAKDHATNGTVTLQDKLNIRTDMKFALSENGNKLVLGNHDALLMQENTTITGANTQNYIVAEGDGWLEKTTTTDGNFFFPVGDAMNYSPLAAYYNGSSYTTAKIKVNVKAAIAPNKLLYAESYLERYWSVAQVGISDYFNTLEGSYLPADIAVGSTELLIKGATFDGTEWDYINADNFGGLVAASTDDATVHFTGMNTFGKLDLKVFLQGPYISSTGLMRTTLSGLAAFPLTSPYAADPITVTSIPADVTDWVLVELRDIGTPSVVVSAHSAFLKKDGSVVHPDGSSKLKVKDPTVFFAIAAIRHRNHLPARTDIAIDLVDPILFEFNTGIGIYTDFFISNEPMATVEPGVYGLFRANVRSDNFINGLDLGMSKLNSNPPKVAVYSNFDVNLDGNVNGLDFGQSKISTNPPKTAHID